MVPTNSNRLFVFRITLVGNHDHTGYVNFVAVTTISGVSVVRNVPAATRQDSHVSIVVINHVSNLLNRWHTVEICSSSVDVVATNSHTASVLNSQDGNWLTTIRNPSTSTPAISIVANTTRNTTVNATLTTIEMGRVHVASGSQNPNRQTVVPAVVSQHAVFTSQNATTR